MPPFLYTILYILTAAETAFVKNSQRNRIWSKGQQYFNLSNSYAAALYNNNGRTDYEN